MKKLQIKLDTILADIIENSNNEFNEVSKNTLLFTDSRFGVKYYKQATSQNAIIQIAKHTQNIVKEFGFDKFKDLFLGELKNVLRRKVNQNSEVEFSDTVKLDAELFVYKQIFTVFKNENGYKELSFLFGFF